MEPEDTSQSLIIRFYPWPLKYSSIFPNSMLFYRSWKQSFTVNNYIGCKFWCCEEHWLEIEV